VEYLPFRIAGRDFVVDASRVRAIVPFEGHHHDVPLVDLRKRLGLPELAYGRRPILVVLDLTSFVVDYVSDVIRGSEKDCRDGKLRARGRPKWVLDPDSLRIQGVSSLSPQKPALARVSRPE
jgi:chemotaxis signal transduction protein